VENKDLKSVYDEMHSKGQSSWFSDGQEERELILKMGEPWEDVRVIEIGCGEGDLSRELWEKKARIFAIDYSPIAIEKAREKHGNLPFYCEHYRKFGDGDNKVGRLVMQGVLEHLDYPFDELKWMMENLLTDKGDVITSSPCFLNPRGLVWMTLDMLGAVMSKTDLHFIHPWDMRKFCKNEGYKMEWDTCDWSWGDGDKMIEDLRQRIPLALKDGGIPCDDKKFITYMEWLDTYNFPTLYGATAVYKITKS